jgi:2-polyprenyl-3-methyl-5-hydroxy-6-metoxy-1,4-benzoquinol methylase
MTVARTVEPQYDSCVEIARTEGFYSMGMMTNQVWAEDPKRIAFLLARYKFVGRMLEGRNRVLEVGCADAFGTRVVKQMVGHVTATDIDPLFIENAKGRNDPRWPLELKQHDMLLGPVVPGGFDGAYSLDVLEHIPAADERRFLGNLVASLNDGGAAVIGMPSLNSQAYASPQSKAGHVNCKQAADFKALMQEFFQHVFMFSMNDEVVHTGFHAMAHYYLALGCGKR